MLCCSHLPDVSYLFLDVLDTKVWMFCVLMTLQKVITDNTIEYSVVAGPAIRALRLDSSGQITSARNMKAQKYCDPSYLPVIWPTEPG